MAYLINSFVAFLLLSALALGQNGPAVGQFSIPGRVHADGGLTPFNFAMTPLRLWGTNSAGAPQPIALGSGLSLSGGTLTASGGSGGGSLNSVALTAPSIFTVTGSPLTADGTIALSLGTQTANKVWAGPASGAAAAPTFRALVANDLPDMSSVYQPFAAALTTFATNGSAYYRSRANHTGTQLLATISDAGSLAGLSAVTTSQITDGTITDADISASATIALSKLATDPLARANHTGTQLLATISDAGALAALSAVTTSQITDSTIVNADISTSAAIALSKLATDPLARANHTGTQDWSTLTNVPVNLSTYAGIAPSPNVQTLLGAANFAAFKVSLSLGNVENTALSTWAGSTNLTTLGTITAGTWNGAAIGDAYISSASVWSAKESALTFSTGLTRSVNTITVNATQSISKLSNLTSNGFVKASGGDGTLSIDTSTYLTSAAADNVYQPLNSNLNTLAAGFGGLFVSPGLVRWNGTGYELLSSGVPTTAGGTGLYVYTLGDMLYSSGSSTALSKLSGNTSTTKKFLTQTGDGLASAAPAWGTVAASDLTGTSANVQTLLGAADYAAFKASLSLGNVENVAISGWVGSSNILTVGAVSSGIWQATAIADAYISSASIWNGKESALTFSSPLSRSTNTISLAASGVTAATYGTSTAAPSLTVNTYGLITGVTTNTITPAVGSITGLGTGVASALGTNTGSLGAPVLFNLAGGTPSSITLTNGTGLPVSGITSSTTTGLGLGSIELGHASDTTLTRSSAGVLAVEGVNVLLSGGALGTPSSGNVTNCTVKEHIIVPCSDETTALTTGVKRTFRMPCAMTLTSVLIEVNTAPTGSVIVVDVKAGGSTIFSTKPQIAISAFDSYGGAVPGVLSTTSLPIRTEIIISVDQIGSTIAGKGIKVTFIGTRQ